MARPNIAPYGSWKSPVTAEVVAGGEVGLEQVRLDGDDVYWIERRSQESGRKVIVRRSPDGRATDVTPASLNARTRVHEYGGGDYAVSDGTIVFANFTDQRLYAQRVGSPPRPLTPAASLRYADGVIDRRRNLLFCVCEDHTGHGEAINTLVSIDLHGGGARCKRSSANPSGFLAPVSTALYRKTGLFVVTAKTVVITSPHWTPRRERST